MDKFIKFLFLAILQFILPGLGHLLIGKKKAGLIFITLFVVYLVAAVWAVLPMLFTFWWFLPLISVVHLLTYFVSFRPLDMN